MAVKTNQPTLQTAIWRPSETQRQPSAGGLISRLLFGGYYGLILAFACAFGIVYLIRRSRGGDLTHPGARR